MNNSEIEEKLGKEIDKKSRISRYSMFVCKIGEVPIYIHFSFALIFTLIAWSLSYTFFPVYYPGLSQLSYIVLGVTGASIALFSIMFHELGHSTIANKYGVKFEKIVLFAFGGIALSSRELTNPKKEINMAFAGPSVSFIICSLLFALWLIVFQSQVFALQDSPVGGILYYGGLINLAIGLFNLLPVFPSDGGRILRAFLSMRMHNHVKGYEGCNKDRNDYFSRPCSSRSDHRFEIFFCKWSLANGSGLLPNNGIQMVLQTIRILVFFLFRSKLF